MPPTSEKMDTAADPPPAKEEAVKEGAEGNANADDDGEVELSDEDRQLKEELEGLVEQVKGEDTSVHKAAFLQMRTTICAATSTMTSVPKPLKFLRPHYETIKELFDAITDADTKAASSDVLSLLAMTQEGSRDT